MKIHGIHFLALGLLGAGLGFLFSRASEYGWLATRWEPIDQPPEDVKALLAVNGDLLWIRGELRGYLGARQLGHLRDSMLENRGASPNPPAPDRSLVSLDPFPCAPPRPLDRRPRLGRGMSMGDLAQAELCVRPARTTIDPPLGSRDRMEWAFINEFCTASFGALAAVAVAMGLLLALRSEVRPPSEDLNPQSDATRAA